MKKILIFIAGFVSFGVLALIYALINYQPNDEIINLDSYVIYNKVNEYRALNGLKMLKFNPELCPFAEKRLKDIHSNYSHEGYHLANKNKDMFFIDKRNTGENLAKGYSTEEEAVKNWINSKSHRDNILNASFTDTCIKSDYQYEPEGLVSYTVQIFSSF